MAYNSIKNLSIHLIFWLFICLLLASCQTDTGLNNLRKFYFPLDELSQKPLVYTYETQADSSFTNSFVQYEVNTENNVSILKSTHFNSDLTISQITQEEVISNGMLMLKSTIIQTDSSGNQIPTPVEIEAGATFPFKLTDTNDIFFYKIKYYEVENPSYYNTITRNRFFQKDTSYSFQNKILPAVKFNVRELITNVRDGHLEHEFEGYEIYAEGIGLIYFQKNITADFKLISRLKEIRPADEM